MLVAVGIEPKKKKTLTTRLLQSYQIELCKLYYYHLNDQIHSLINSNQLEIMNPITNNNNINCEGVNK